MRCGKQNLNFKLGNSRKHTVSSAQLSKFDGFMFQKTPSKSNIVIVLFFSRSKKVSFAKLAIASESSEANKVQVTAISVKQNGFGSL